jgi:transposase-like protein
LQRHAESGLSIRRFCANEGVSEPSFFNWRRKLRRQAKDGEPAANEADQSRLFVPLTLLEATPSLEIVHPTGCRIQVNGDVNPVALQTVIEVLDQRGGP